MIECFLKWLNSSLYVYKQGHLRVYKKTDIVQMCAAQTLQSYYASISTLILQ